MDFIPSGISQGEAVTLTNKFRFELSKQKEFKVYEREDIAAILKEQGFQQVGCTTDQCAVEIGKLIGVNNVIVGSVGNVGKIFSIITRVINVETGEIVKIAETNVQGTIEELFLNGVRDNVNQIVSGKDQSKCSIVTYGFITSKTDSVPVYSAPNINSIEIGYIKKGNSYQAADGDKRYWKVCINNGVGFVPKVWTTQIK